MDDLAGLVFVLTDGHRARYIRPGPDNAPHTIVVVDLAAADSPAYNRPGRARSRMPTVLSKAWARMVAVVGPQRFASNTGPPGTCGNASSGAPEHAQIPWTHLLAARLAEEFAVDLFTCLVLVAPAYVLRDLVATIDAPTSTAVIGTLARDFVYLSDLELWPHLRTWIPPIDGG